MYWVFQQIFVKLNIRYVYCMHITMYRFCWLNSILGWLLDSLNETLILWNGFDKHDIWHSFNVAVTVNEFNLLWFFLRLTLSTGQIHFWMYQTKYAPQRKIPVSWVKIILKISAVYICTWKLCTYVLNFEMWGNF